ncbi:phage tail tape measure protein [Clostridioides difficile]|nr:phage tail tape measure protein [Clostridioides difficile]NJK15934.1 phage tail tape measure protein [Clostridioides difficile]
MGTAGVAEAMKRGGSVLHEYGVSLGDTVGMITATNEAIQNPEKVGNGLKSVAINLAGMKVSADDGTLSLNKTAKGLKEIAGITIYKNKDTGELKNMVQLLDELKGKWGELREDEQKGLAEAIAGKLFAVLSSDI